MRLADGLQGPLLQVDIAQIIVHEADEPNAIVDLLDSEPLTDEHGRDVDLLLMQMRPQAVTRMSLSWKGYSRSGRPS